MILLLIVTYFLPHPRPSLPFRALEKDNNMEILKKIDSESGLEFFERVNPRKRLLTSNDLSPPLPPEVTIGPREVIEVTGGHEKRTFLAEVMVSVLTESRSSVLFLNLEHKMNAADFRELLILKLSEKQEFSEDRLADCLRRLIFLPIFDPETLEVTFHGLRSILASNSEVGLVTLDSVTSFFNLERSKRNIYLDSYVSNVLTKILESAKLEIPLMFSRENIFEKKSEVRKTRRCKEVTMQIEVKSLSEIVVNK